MVARAPKRNLNVALVALDELKQPVILRGDPGKLGHFFIELDNGQRYLDANLDGMHRARIVLPRTRRLSHTTRTVVSRTSFRSSDDRMAALASPRML